MAGQENRRLMRFDLEIPVRVDHICQIGTEEDDFLLSRDLSGDGAFVFTKNPLPVNAMVRLNLIMDIKSLGDPAQRQYSLIKVQGTVNRSESAGMAICFGNEFKISPIEGSIKKKGDTNI